MARKRKPVIQRIEELKKQGKKGTEIAEILRSEGYTLPIIQVGFCGERYGVGSIRQPSGEVRLHVSDQPLDPSKYVESFFDATDLPYIVWSKPSVPAQEKPKSIPTGGSAIEFPYKGRELKVYFLKKPVSSAVASSLCQICKKRVGLLEEYTITEIVDGNTTEVLPLKGRTASIVRKVLKAHEYVICGSWKCISKQHDMIEQALIERGKKRARKS